ncbi:MAG: PHP domain-containing protein [Anaerolineales bacterium]|nr:PHP domain-containing protein [Anaerolineales bacterium]
MSDSTSLYGLAYKKLDLHIHTPASRCFKGDCTPEEIVQAAIDLELDGIAITDHNTAEWVDQVKEAAVDKPLVVFPGVEISCTGGKQGIHVIGLLDISCNSKHIEAILNVIGIQPDNYGLQEAITNKSPIEVIEIIDSQGGLAVLAHANSSHGVLSDMSGQGRIRIVQCPELLAAEGTDFADEEKKQKGKRVIDLLNGNDPDYRRRLAVYQASDNPCPDDSGRHCLEGIGSRFSYFKMEIINLESLRQCFIDPDVRIRQVDEVPSFVFPRIKSVRINSGFLDGQKLEFHPGLTSILGGKGAGKSLLIEFMRFALNQESSNPTIYQDHIAKLRSRLGEYGSVEIVFVDENAKESNITRTFRELDGSPYDDSVPYDPAQIFPVLFLSQNEIIKIAENEIEQLNFIDQFFDFHAYRAEISSIEKELERLDKIMADGLRAYSEFDEISVKISTLDKEISKLDEALKNPIFEEFQRIEEKEGVLRDQRDFLIDLVDSIEKSKDAILSIVKPEIPNALRKDPALLRNIDLITKAHETIAESLANLTREVSKSSGIAEDEYRAWHPKYKAGKKKYEDYVQEIGGDYKGIALSRERLVKQRTDLQKRLEIVGAKKNDVPETSNKRNGLLDRLQEVYKAYTDERKSKCEKFQEDSAGKLKLSILDQLNVDQFRENLLSLKRGSYLRDDEISTITMHVNPRDFIISLLRYEATKESKHLKGISEASLIGISRMKILADFLLSAIPFEELLSLQYRAQPQDRPKILYDIGDGDYQPLTSISVGQKCTAMLLMALSDGLMPIVIDQPEDSIDIRSVWDDMCTKLRTGKENRQFIFTTHNSSLAVASDTDCYLILEGDASHGRLVYLGSMDHDPLSEEVMKYLEGGKETYELKFDKYGGALN